jgi:hypothetical protein
VNKAIAIVRMLREKFCGNWVVLFMELPPLTVEPSVTRSLAPVALNLVVSESSRRLQKYSAPGGGRVVVALKTLDQRKRRGTEASMFLRGSVKMQEIAIVS